MSEKYSKDWQLGFDAGLKVRAAEISVLSSQIECLVLDLKEFEKSAQLAVDNYKKFHNNTQEKEKPEHFGMITSQTLRALEWWLRRIKNTLVITNSTKTE
jgi:hypothetical protein